MGAAGFPRPVFGAMVLAAGRSFSNPLQAPGFDCVSLPLDLPPRWERVEAPVPLFECRVFSALTSVARCTRASGMRAGPPPHASASRPAWTWAGNGGATAPASLARRVNQRCHHQAVMALVPEVLPHFRPVALIEVGVVALAAGPRAGAVQGPGAPLQPGHALVVEKLPAVVKVEPARGKSAGAGAPNRGARRETGCLPRRPCPCYDCAP